MGLRPARGVAVFALAAALAAGCGGGSKSTSTTSHGYNVGNPPVARAVGPGGETGAAGVAARRNPKRAAQYYNVVRSICHGCTIVAADVLDSPNLAHWLAAFKKAAKGKPRLWGLHNYTDTNRFRSAGTKTMLRLVPGQLWLTETGGIVSFTTSTGKVALKPNETRARRAIDFL